MILGDNMAENGTRQFVKYNFFKVMAEWRRLPDRERVDSKREFAAVVEEWRTHMFIRSYSLVGLRGDADILLWQACESLEQLQEMMTSVWKTRLGGYLEHPYSYLAMTHLSQYVGQHRHEGQEGASTRLRPGSHGQYFIVYPFLKTRQWHVLPREERQRMMSDHIRIGHKYPTVKINTAYSFGLDDPEFVLGFEMDDPGDFLQLVEELRMIPTSQYTESE
ncbi:MAG: chlorite dismutase family protein, partial [Ardenticatenaceae bacterium]